MTERKFTPFEDNGIQEYVTRDGREAKVCVATCASSLERETNKLKGFVKNPEGVWIGLTWEFNGGSLSFSGLDLFDVPVKHTRWVNVYSNTSGVHHTNGGLYLDKVEADGYAGKTCVACIEITFEEGEGL
jgi:hypothetical protein